MLLALMLAGLLVLMAISLPTSWRGLASYEPLHTLLETAAIAVAVLVFSVGWNTRQSGSSRTLLVVACAFAGVALLDLSHVLSYQGMPDYVTPSDPEKAINFWLVARLYAAAALLLAVSASWQTKWSPMQRYVVLLLALLPVALAHWAFLFHPQEMPRTFIAGQGLTALKVGTEYFIIALNLVAAALLWRRMRGPLSFDAPSLLGAVLAMAMSEFFFTLYADVTDAYNLAGHLYKVVSYLFLYRGLYVQSVERPYQALDEARTTLANTLRAVPDLVFEVDAEGRYLNYHSPHSDLLAAPPNAFLGKTVREVLPAPVADRVMQAVRETLEQGSVAGRYIQLELPSGLHSFELSSTRMEAQGGQPLRVLMLSRDVTERLQMEERLRLMDASVSHLNDMVVITQAEPMSGDGPAIVYVNPAFERATGYTAAEVIGKTPRILQGPDTDPAETARIGSELRAWKTVHAELLNYTKDGRPFWVELRITPLADAKGWYTHWVAVQRDVTDQVNDRNALQAALQYNRAVLDNMADGVITIGQDGNIRSFSKAAIEIFGYTAQEVLGRNVSLLMPEPHRSRHDGYIERHASTGVNRIMGRNRDLEGMRKDGTVFPMNLAVTKTEHQGETTYIGLVRDITQRRMNEEEIRRLAYYDGLTGLPNRRLLTDHLRHAIVSSGRTAMYGAVMFLDLDHFKNINDTLGHAMGDEMLRQVGSRLLSSVREGDTVARLGGDEFVLVLENLSRDQDEASQRAEAVASKVLSTLSQPYFLGAKDHPSSTSIGVVMFLRDQKGVDVLLKEADAALYQAKAAGRNTFSFYDPEVQASAVARSQMEEDIRRGLAGHEFQLHYQLQVHGTERKPVGVEALVRWQHPERGMVPPNQFIPLAEDSGLILPLGQWVLETACNQLAAWAYGPTEPLSIAVNVSAMQFAQEDFVERVHSALEKAGARPERLKIELTESALAASLDDIIRKMTALKQLGVTISLDDFGTGYSSLSYLKRLPLDQLKIDQSFVRDLLTDPNDASIARTIVSLGHSLGLTVIAEGVENEGQCQFLEGIGCLLYQGYHFGRPVLPEVLEASLARR